MFYKGYTAQAQRYVLFLYLNFFKEINVSRKDKKRGYLKDENERLTKALIENGKAMEIGPKKKHWSNHDIKNIKPIGPNQEEMFHAFFNNFHICAHGTAGTGKTFLALYLAFSEMFKHEGKVNHIIIIRSAVSTRDIGFMPGDLDEKVSFYEMPYRDMCAVLFGRYSTYDDMKEAGKIRFLTTSFIRGLTWDNAVVIIDEGQNMDFHEINSIMTRIGENTRLIFTGDLQQSDLRKGTSSQMTGMDRFLKVIRNMKEFTDIEFTKHDIVRSRFVKSWICACEETK